MTQDTIDILKVLSPKKALINGKSSEWKKRFLRKIMSISIKSVHIIQTKL